MRDNSEILDNPVNSSIAERLKATEDLNLAVNYEKNRGQDKKDDFKNCSSCFLSHINIWWNNDIWKIPDE